MGQQEVNDWYKNCAIDYRMVWDLNNSMGINYGYWDSYTKNFPEAIKNMNKYMAKRADIKGSKKVLDAGCGVGGPSIYLAKNLGCQVDGINVVEDQIKKAKENAKKHGVSHLVNYKINDFTSIDFPDNTFDVVWALESLPQADDRFKVFEGAYKVLKKGGKLVVADFLNTEKLRTEKENSQIQRWQKSWAMPEFLTVNKYNNLIKKAGFNNINNVDVSENIRPSASRLYRGSIPGIFVSKILEFLRIRNKTQTEHAWSAYIQYVALKRGLWQYRVISAEK